LPPCLGRGPSLLHPRCMHAHHLSPVSASQVSPLTTALDLTFQHLSPMQASGKTPPLLVALLEDAAKRHFPSCHVHVPFGGVFMQSFSLTLYGAQFQVSPHACIPAARARGVQIHGVKQVVFVMNPPHLPPSPPVKGGFVVGVGVGPTLVVSGV